MIGRIIKVVAWLRYLKMDATAHVSFDRAYFEAFYTDWLTHRSRWRRFAMPVAFAITFAGAAISWFVPGHRFLGIAVSLGGMYHLYEALTHRRRWVADRLKDLPPDKVLDVSFHSERIDMETPNSSSRLSVAALTGVEATPNGLFLIPQTGVSIYIPRASIEPSDAFSPLVESLDSAIRRRKQDVINVVIDG